MFILKKDLWMREIIDLSTKMDAWQKRMKLHGKIKSKTNASITLVALARLNKRCSINPLQNRSIEINKIKKN